MKSSMARRRGLHLLCPAIFALLPLVHSGQVENLFQHYSNVLQLTNNLVQTSTQKYEDVKETIMQLSVNSPMFVLASYEAHNLLAADASTDFYTKHMKPIEDQQRDLNAATQELAKSFVYKEFGDKNWPPVLDYGSVINKNKTKINALESKCKLYLNASAYSHESFVWLEQNEYRLTHVESTGPVGRTIFATTALSKLVLDYTATLGCHSVLRIPLMPNFVTVAANAIKFIQAWNASEKASPSITNDGVSTTEELKSSSYKEGKTSLFAVLCEYKSRETKKLIENSGAADANLVNSIGKSWDKVLSFVQQETIVAAFPENKGDERKNWYLLQNSDYPYGTYLYPKNDKLIFVGTYRPEYAEHFGTGQVASSLKDASDFLEKYETNSENVYGHEAEYIAKDFAQSLKNIGYKYRAVLVVFDEPADSPVYFKTNYYLRDTYTVVADVHWYGNRRPRATAIVLPDGRS